MENRKVLSLEIPNDSVSVNFHEKIKKMKNSPKFMADYKNNQIKDRSKVYESNSLDESYEIRKQPKGLKSLKSAKSNRRLAKLSSLPHSNNASPNKNFNTNLIATVGRMIKVIFKAKRRLRYENIYELSGKQIELINDRSFHLKEKPDSRKKKSFKNFGSYLQKYFLKKSKQLEPKLEFFLILLILLKAKKFFGLSSAIKWIPVIKPTHKFFLFWNILLCFSILFQLFSITIELFFDVNWKKDGVYFQIFTPLDLFFKVIFLLDILLRLNTGYFQSGEIVTSRSKILWSYLKSSLLIDLIGCFSLFYPLSNENADLLPIHVNALRMSSMNAFKLLFLLNLATLNNNLNALRELVYHNQKMEGALLLLKLTVQIIFAAHLFACLWYFSAVFNENSTEGISTWMDKIDYNSHQYWFQSYIASLYWSLATMITVGYGDVAANNIYEQTVAMVAMILGGGFFAYSINSIGVIVQKIEEKEKELRENLRVINKFMRRKKVDFGLQVKVRKYLEHIWVEEDGGDKNREDAILNKLSVSLRQEVLVQSYSKALTSFPSFFKNFSIDSLERISQSLRSVTFAPGDIIFHVKWRTLDQNDFFFFFFKQGEELNKMLYFIESGEIELHGNTDGGKTEFTLKILKSGDVLGHYEIFREGLRDFSARSIGFSRVYTLSREDLIASLKRLSEDWEKFHMFKDLHILYGELCFKEATCYHCDDFTHIYKECPFMHLNMDRDLVLRRHLHSPVQERGTHARKPIKSQNALIMNLGNFRSLSKWKRAMEKESEENFKGTLEASLIHLETVPNESPISKEFSLDLKSELSKFSPRFDEGASEVMAFPSINKYICSKPNPVLKYLMGHGIFVRQTAHNHRRRN